MNTTDNSETRIRTTQRRDFARHVPLSDWVADEKPLVVGQFSSPFDPTEQNTGTRHKDPCTPVLTKRNVCSSL